MPPSAAFLDRDGTIIRDADYVDDPGDVELVPGSDEAIRLLNARAVPVLVVTNQSGIGRGYYSEEDFRRVQEEVERRLAMRGCALDGVFYCPHAPEESCDCRKPELGMYRSAAERHDVRLSDAFYVGDKVSDVLPARRTGGRGFLVRTGKDVDAEEVPEGVTVVADLLEAVREALGTGSPKDRDGGSG